MSARCQRNPNDIAQKTSRELVKDLIEHVRATADEALSEPDAESGTINVDNSSRMLVESGRDDLLYAESLFAVFDRLDALDRELAYSGLHRLIAGTFNIAGHGIIPNSAVKQAREDRGAWLRRRKKMANADRKKAISEAIGRAATKSRSLKLIYSYLQKDEELARRKISLPSQSTIKRLIGPRRARKKN